MSNRTVLDAGFKAAKEKIFGHLYDCMVGACQDFIDDAVESAEYANFTGNTVTSYTCGLFIDGSLNHVVSSGEQLDSPVFRKVKLDETIVLEEPYDGAGPRAVTGSAYIAYDMSGEGTAYELLTQSKPNKKGIFMRMTTGTEYSNFLESTRKLNVLTCTSKPSTVKELIGMNMKKMK